MMQPFFAAQRNANGRTDQELSHVPSNMLPLRSFFRNMEMTVGQGRA